MPEWFEGLGFDNNPFSRVPVKIGNEEELNEIFYSILAGNMVFVEGPAESGKTSLLREAVRRFGGRKKIIYVNCKNLRKELNVERLLKDRYGFLGRIFNLKPKNMILLLDEVEHLTERNCERIKYYYDQNYLRAVVFTSRNIEQAGFNRSILHRINKVIRVQPLSDYEAVKAVRDVIGNRLLSDRAIKRVYASSEKNVGKLMKNCERILMNMAREAKKEISEEEIDKVLVAQ